MKLLFVLTSLLLSVTSLAQDSGCGLGSVIIQKNSKGLQLLSWTTNGIFFTQPLGITSGTSGCSSSGLVQNDKQIEYFVEVNNDDLSREMARGEGEKLQVLAQLHGCQDQKAQKAFSEMSKNSYSQIYTTSSSTANEVLANLKAQMKNNSEVQAMCHTASL